MPPSVMDRVATAATRVRQVTLEHRAHAAALRAKGQPITGSPAKGVTARARVEAPAMHTGRVGTFVPPTAGVGVFVGNPHSTGAAIVAIPADPAVLAVDGGDPPERLHVTLAYLGKTAALDADAVMAVHDAAEAASYDLDGGFDAQVVGYGVLGSENPPATVLYLQAPELAQVHGTTWSELDDYGADRFAPKHPGWIPHLTLGYGVPLDAAAAWHGKSVRFDYLAVLLADEPTVYRIGGDLDDAAPDSARLAVGTFAPPRRYLTVDECRARARGEDTGDLDLVVRLADGSTIPVAEWAAQDSADTAVVAAGMCVRAADTGRILMLQRGIVDGEDDPAAGTWEFPGGKLDDGEDALVAARREFGEEVGLAPPTQDPTDSWTSPDGVYVGFVVDVATEAEYQPWAEDRAITNPDDPDGDYAEAMAWWEPADAAANPALRDELKGCTVWDILGVTNSSTDQEAP